MNRTDFARLLGAPEGVVAESPPSAIVIEEADPRRFMSGFAAAVSSGGVVLLASPGWSEAERGQLSALRGQEQVTPATAAGKGWLCIPTGGTGGRLRFARHDEETLSAAVRGFARHFQLTQVNAVGLLPLYHVSGLLAWLRCALTGGEYLPVDWKAVEGGVCPELPQKPQGWMISLVPTQLERLLRQEVTVEWLRQFRIIFLGGGPAWPELLARAAGLGLPVSLGYGMTETAAMVTALRPEEFLLGERSSGAPLPHATVKIDGDGTIVIAGDSLFRGYHPHWRDPWDFVTGDRGSLDGRGHLHVAGRRDAVIITGGEKVEPAEVEAVLRDTGEFAGVVVLGVADAEWGEVVVAAYPASTCPDLAKVGESTARLAPLKRPKRYVPLADWPVNAQGKVDRERLLTLLGNLKPGS